MGIEIDIATPGLVTAQQLHDQLVAQRGDVQQQRDMTVQQQAADLAAIDQALALFDARIAELAAFIAYQQAQGGA